MDTRVGECKSSWSVEVTEGAAQTPFKAPPVFELQVHSSILANGTLFLAAPDTG